MKSRKMSDERFAPLDSQISETVVEYKEFINEEPLNMEASARHSAV